MIKLLISIFLKHIFKFRVFAFNTKLLFMKKTIYRSLLQWQYLFFVVIKFFCDATKLQSWPKYLR